MTPALFPTPQLPIRNGSEVRDPLVTYEGSIPPASPLQGDSVLQGVKHKACVCLMLVSKPSPPTLHLVCILPCASRSPLFLSAPGWFFLTPPVFPDNLVIALHSYEPSHDGDLGFEKGEQLRILEQ